ncbi:MAG: periplasmic binding domain protein [Nocardioides sp.]|nr:periplasmic binding domain protein [Nocardioides sp.]
MNLKRSTTIACVLAASLAALSACSSGDTTDATQRESASGVAENGSSGDITTQCGDKPAKVGYLKSAGGNTWVLQSAAEFQSEAAKCDNITDALFSQAIGDQQKAISDISSFVAQGVNVLVISADYGVAELPAIKKATAAGVQVVTILGDAGGQRGTDFLESVAFDTDAIAESWASFLDEKVGSGTVAFLGGTPGNETSTAFFGSFQKAMEQYPDIKIVDNRVQDTNWDPVLRRKVMAGLLSKNGRIDAIVSDFNAPDMGALQAYDDAGMERPVVASITGSNQLNCDWADNPYPYMTLGQTSSLTRLALRIGLAAYEGVDNTEPTAVLPKPFTYEPDGNAPTCNTDFPPDADLTADLTQEELTALFSN